MAATKDVLVSYQENKKILCLPVGSGGNDLQNLTRAFKKEFKIDSKADSITFQCFHKSWNEYIDIDVKKKIQDGDRLKVIISQVSKSEGPPYRGQPFCYRETNAVAPTCELYKVPHSVKYVSSEFA